MSVQASSEHVLMVDRRRGIQHRRLIANFGDTPYPIQGVDDEYHVLLTSGVQQPSSVVVPARTGVILAW
jgi:hypothetical protein